MPGLSAPVTSCKLNLTTIKRLVFCVKLFNLDSQTVYSPIPVFPLGMQIVLHGRSLGSACRAKRIRRTCLMQLSDSTRWHLRLIYIYALMIYVYIYIYGTPPPPPKPTFGHFLTVFTVFCNLFGTLNFEANFEGGPYIYIYICIHLFIFLKADCTESFGGILVLGSWFQRGTSTFLVPTLPHQSFITFCSADPVSQILISYSPKSIFTVSVTFL